MLKIRAKKNVVVEAYTMEFYLIFVRMCVCACARITLCDASRRQGERETSCF